MDIETLRHSAAHLLAQAVKELFPDVKLGIGPAIEKGFYYDFQKDEPFTPEDLKKIEKKMKALSHQKLTIEQVSMSDDDLEDYYRKESFKKELAEELDKPIFFKQGNFIDLCKGPHVEDTGKIKNYKLMKVSGAYWKGDASNQQLQRIYGVIFETKEELKEYLHMLEEAEKRNHIKLGKELGLYSFHKEGPGFPFMHPKGMIFWNEIMKLWKEKHDDYEYVEIRTPIILNKELWVKSGHWENYRDNMYETKIDKDEVAIKPMNCPGGILWYNERLHSYREFPMRVAEIGLVHRHELSGVLNGMFRVRAFHQDDAHIYMTKTQIQKEVLNVLKLTDELYSAFGLKYHLELSTRPEKRIGKDKDWDLSEKALKKALEKYGMKYDLNEGDGAFYGPKIDVHIKDALGRTWQCATIQLDMNLPERFDMTFEGKDGKKHRPIMIHRTIYGGVERFVGIIVEHFGGKFPLWLSPVQVRILNVTDRNLKFARAIAKKMKKKGIRAEVDDRAETISKKVRSAQVEKVPIMVTIGDKEEENKTLAVRTRDGKLKFGVESNDLMKKMVKNIKDRELEFSC
ncbi:threonine--tRNA ligase [archaeon]|jgi:threonyl-tRNA synthetase|nr:threonine--tRNA ligase [archaeon]MBT4397803.1 threonine--tRNA ligase [archaeon]MBT4441137.1 threonine--tRNA ligase [archaeon]